MSVVVVTPMQAFLIAVIVAVVIGIGALIVVWKA